MLKCSSPAGGVVVVAMLAAGAAGCGQISAHKGKLAFREANTYYNAQNYDAAARKYAEAIEQGCNSGNCNPQELAFSYFFLASSYDNMFRPVKKGDPKNDANLTKAIDYYEQASEKTPDETFRKRALQYMVAVYGVEKLNEPSKAEPIIKRLIELDPKDAANYYGMSKLYEDAGDFPNAEAQLLKARDMRPDDPEVYGRLAAFYEARGQFDKQIEAMTTRTLKEPNSPEAQYRIAVAYWNRACVPVNKLCQNLAGPVNMRAKYVAAGLEASQKALALREDYIDALAYKNLLLRSKAYLEPAKSAELIKDAEALVAQIGDIQKRRQGAPAQAKAGKPEE
jgi:tetratricopeptide (TPR) repeat protein